MNLYDFVVLDQNGNEVSLDKFKGKVVLVVNTATGCGFTPQYNELQKLYEEFAGDGFEILDFPCNQFGEQAPGTNEEIHDFLRYYDEVVAVFVKAFTITKTKMYSIVKPSP